MPNNHDEIEVVPYATNPETFRETKPVVFLDRSERAPYEKAMDDHLIKAESAATLALTKAEEAIGWLGILGPVSNRHVPHAIQKLIAEIQETKRLRQ